MAEEDVLVGRAAFEDQRWADAFSHLSAADRSTMGVEDLERIAISSYLIGEDLAGTDAWKQAHQRHLTEESAQAAARCAFWLAFGLINRGEMAQAQGWLARAERILDDADLVDCPERGYLMLPGALHHMADGDWKQAHQILEQMAELGVRFRDPELSVFGRLGVGQCRVALGAVEEGLVKLDEVMVSVTAGEISPIVAGIAYCAVIDTCQEAFDLRRAQEWTNALTRWCDSQPDLVPYRGQCLVHRSELMQIRGAWPEAMEEARRARARLSDPPGQPAVGRAFYQLGELNRLRGDLDGAEDAYRQAHEHGRFPEPGLALLRLAQGRIEAAAASSRRSVAEAIDVATRSKLLPAHVEIMLAAGDISEASAAAEELTSLATGLDVPLFDAFAARSRGAVLLASGEVTAALENLRIACELWRDLDVPYETARTRVMLGLACRRLGDEDGAGMELQAARTTFEELGAVPELHRLDATVGEARPATGLTPREAEVLALVATGKTNREIASDLVISDKTVARHISNIFLKLDLSSRAAATAYAYEHDLV